MPHTLYPIPYILYPIPYTLYPIPYTLYHKPYTLYPILYTLYPIPYTLYLPYTLPLAFNPGGCQILVTAAPPNGETQNGETQNGEIGPASPQTANQARRIKPRGGCQILVKPPHPQTARSKTARPKTARGGPARKSRRFGLAGPISPFWVWRG